MNRSPSFVAESEASPRESCDGASRLDWNYAEQNSTFVGKMQELLGEDCLPDAEFFVRCWTEGATTAADDLLDRHRLKKERASSPGRNFSSFIPTLSAEEFVLSQRIYASWVSTSQVGDERSQNPPENEDPGANWDSDFDNGDPLTVERACRLLGVTASSSQAQIKGAYRHLARLYHPDHLEGKGSRVQQTATERMIAINKAYHVLGSGRLRQSGSSMPSSQSWAR